jgi:hypothetical protein
VTILTGAIAQTEKTDGEEAVAAKLVTKDEGLTKDVAGDNLHHREREDQDNDPSGSMAREG